MEDHGRDISAVSITGNIVVPPAKKTFEITVRIQAADASEALNLIHTAKEISIKEVPAANPWITGIQNC